MHKEEASKLFRVLGNETRVKIVKILFNNDKVLMDNFYHIFSSDRNELEMHFALLKEANLVMEKTEGNNIYYICNKRLLNELMSFFKTKCSCCEQKSGE